MVLKQQVLENKIMLLSQLNYNIMSLAVGWWLEDVIIKDPHSDVVVPVRTGEGGGGGGGGL